LNDQGERFMHRYDERGELAPRDIVSRSILAEMRRTRLHVYLDLTHMDAAFVKRRFPRVYDTCLRHGVDITAGPVPVHPAAHYAMGGVRSDINGLTNVERLFAAGEVACSGVHGANRLASNSLLEGLVFGARAGQAMRESAPSSKRGGEIPEPERYPEMSESQVRDIAWEHCGVLRDAAGLTEATRLLGSVPLERVARPAREHYELRNLHAVATLIARCALAREESRGAHYRTDFPDTLEQFQKHSHVDKRSEVRFE
jgi:L-aspartate oxidase